MTHATTTIHRRCTAQMHIDTPLGGLLLARTDKGLAGAWFDAQKHHPGSIDAPECDDDPLLLAAKARIDAYFAGSAGAFVAAIDGVPLDLSGTAFEQSVWAELLRIETGATSTYGALAARLGKPGASRAVGGAVGRNPVSVLVPCHRVVGRAGALTGYAGGLDRKTALLRLEAGAGLPEPGGVEGQPVADAAEAGADAGTAGIATAPRP